MKIYGAGLAGLLAACTFQTATVFEAAPPFATVHKALLRFRTNVVSDAVGIPFRPVQVRKGLWHQNAFREPSIQHANHYARKVTGQLLDRSIWDLASVERFIAPETFIEQLIGRCEKRIHWNAPLTAITDDGPVISTVPMSVMTKMTGPAATPTFTYAPIMVKRWRIHYADVFQTVYIPDPHTSLYRVSITKDLVIAEYMRATDDYNFWPAFGLVESDAEPLDSTTQRFGKIAPIPDRWRKDFIYELSARWNIYSLGRFATWRNILLDDVMHDITVIKRLMAGGQYDRTKLYQ